MDPSCKWIIGGMALAIVGMAGYIVRQHVARVQDLREWIRSLNEYNSMLGLVGDVNRNRPREGGK